jgi:hypothetical protein
MKIIYIGSFRFPIYDAAASRVLNNARALRLYGHEVKFISWVENITIKINPMIIDFITMDLSMLYRMIWI